MCRLFGAISTRPVDVQDNLLYAPHSLFKQSNVDKKRKQGDGWGIGWFESGEPRIFKRPQALYRDKGRVTQAGRRAGGNVAVGHVRWASNPLKLPHGRLIGLVHTQPFQHGPWIFAHNGTLYLPREVKAQLGPWARWIRGNNDSEVLFYWLLKTVASASLSPRRWARRVRASLKTLNRIGKRHRASYPLYKFPYHGLNWVLTNGKMLAAFCFVDPRGFDKGKALGNRKQPYYQLQVKETPNSLTVASEPLDRSSHWHPMRHGQLLLAVPKAGRLIIKKERVL
jgi:predicted glutamine amidotransferase